MTHLRIEQNNGVIEEVSTSIITKLYEIAHAGLDVSSNLQGRLHVVGAYGYQIDYLIQQYPSLYINADKRYLRFEDPVVEQICAVNFGDGTGISENQIQSLQSLNRKFANNTNIHTFDELYLFNNITNINYENSFIGCTNLTSIDLRNITKISGDNKYQRYGFEICTNLESVGDTSNCTDFGYYAFFKCSKLENVIISSSHPVKINSSAFYNCSKLDFSNLSTSITYIGELAFKGVKKLPTVINLPNLTTLGNSAFAENSDIVHIQDLGTIDTFGYGTNSSGQNPFQNCNNIETIILPETVTTIGYGSGNANTMRWIKILSTVVPNLLSDQVFGSTYPIYVRDDLYSTYLTHTDDNWQDFLNRLRPMSQFATDFPNG